MTTDARLADADDRIAEAAPPLPLAPGTGRGRAGAAVRHFPVVRSPGRFSAGPTAISPRPSPDTFDIERDGATVDAIGRDRANTGVMIVGEASVLEAVPASTGEPERIVNAGTGRR